MGGRGRPRGDADTTSLYKTLDIEKSASEREIKKAWRKQAKLLHPDRGGDVEKFKQAEKAYNILSDPAKRELYNEGGLEAVESGGINTGNIFDLFGGRQNNRSREPAKPAAIKQMMTLELEDVYQATPREIEIKILTADGRDVCPQCNGKGSYMETVRRGPMLLQTQRQCPKCDGEGVKFVGKKTVNKKLEVFIPAGVKDGDKKTLESEGHDLPGMPTGDVVIIFKVKKHKIFKRMGADLAMGKELTLVQALTGYDFYVKHINGQDWMRIRNEPGQVVQPGQVICIAEQGLRQKGNRSTKGNVYIKFEVVLPTSGSLNDSARGQIKKILSNKKVQYKMPNQAQNDVREYCKGSKVRLIGLNNRPDLNGVEGTIIEANIRPGQFAVHLATGQTVAVRGELLEFADDMVVETPKATEGPSEDDYVHDVTGSVVDMNKVKHTEAEYGEHTAYDSDEEHGGQNIGGCRQM